MAYTVLARRYRSQVFDDVVGQDAIAQTLKNAIRTNRVAHAYLFTGTRGVGKTTMARILAKSLNCLNSDGPNEKPCLECDSCTSINLGEDIDVIEIDGASNTGVDNIRQLRQNAIYRPARARYKIYIIDEVHMLSTGAFNALLKILEEPPGHVKFIFATTEPNKVLPTIQSRCQRFDFSNIPPETIKKQLEKVLKSEKIQFEEELVMGLARLANGSMRDALSLLDQLISTGTQTLTVELLEEVLGGPNRQKICELIAKIGDKDAQGVLNAADELIASGQSCTQIADSLINFMRDIMVAKSTNPDSSLLVLTKQERQQLSMLTGKFDIAGIVYCISTLEKLHWMVKTSDHPRALLEAVLVRLALSEHFIGVDSLLGRLEDMKDSDHAGTIKKKLNSARDNIDRLASPAQATGKPATDSVSHADNQPLENKDTAPMIPQATEDQDITLTDTQTPPDNEQAGGQAGGQASGQLTTELVKKDWQMVTAAVKAEDEGIGVLLGTAQPAQYHDGVLRLVFSAAEQFSKNICQKRARQIETIVSRILKEQISLRFEISDKISGKPAVQKSSHVVNNFTREQVMNDPAVRQLLTGLGAVVTSIERIGQDQ